jgi:hypothetical protein
MSNEVDMSATVTPKSDQLNADDLIAGPKTIRVTSVKANPSTLDQPVSIHYESDGGKPWKPCKSMRRALIFLWGSKADAYIGRRLTLYRDDSVTWGGIAIGGIRISHADIDGDVTFPLTISKTKRQLCTVKKMPPDAPPRTINALAEALMAAGKNEAERRAWIAAEMPGRAIKSLRQAEINQLYDKASALNAPPEPGSDG